MHQICNSLVFIERSFCFANIAFGITYFPLNIFNVSFYSVNYYYYIDQPSTICLPIGLVKIETESLDQLKLT